MTSRNDAELIRAFCSFDDTLGVLADRMYKLREDQQRLNDRYNSIQINLGRIHEKLDLILRRLPRL